MTVSTAGSGDSLRISTYDRAQVLREIALEDGEINSRNYPRLSGPDNFITSQQADTQERVGQGTRRTDQQLPHESLGVCGSCPLKVLLATS